MLKEKRLVPQLRFSEFEGEWEKKKLSETAIFLYEKRKPIKSSDRNNMKGVYPYYGASGIIDYINDFIFDDELILKPDMDFKETENIIEEIRDSEELIKSLNKKIQMISKERQPKLGDIIITQSNDVLTDHYKRLIAKTMNRVGILKEKITDRSLKSLRTTDTRFANLELQSSIKKSISVIKTDEYIETMMYFFGVNEEMPIIEKMASYHMMNVRKIIPELVKLAGDSFGTASTRAIKNMHHETGIMYGVNKIANLIGVKLYDPLSSGTILSKGFDTFQSEMMFHFSKVKQIIIENSEDTYSIIKVKSQFFTTLLVAQIIMILFSFINLIYSSSLTRKLKQTIIGNTILLITSLHRGIAELIFNISVGLLTNEQHGGKKSKTIKHKRSGHKRSGHKRSKHKRSVKKR